MLLPPARRFEPDERVKLRIGQRLLHRPQPVRPLGVSGRGEMFEEDGMGVEICCHGMSLGDIGDKENPKPISISCTSTAFCTKGKWHDSH
jgi:hypothetical protein